MIGCSRLEEADEVMEASPQSTVAVTPSPTVLVEETAAATLTPTVVETPTETAVATEESGGSATEVSEPVDLGSGFERFAAESFDIQLSYPVAWFITEDPELGLIIESSEGYLDTMPDEEGATLIIFPEDDLADLDIVEALRQSVFNLGPSPELYIDYPTVEVVNGQSVATAAFRDDSGISGYYVFIQNGDRGAFIFAATTGIAKAYYNPMVDLTIGSITLGSEASDS